MDPELKYTPIKLKEYQPQLMDINEDTQQATQITQCLGTNSRRDSIAVHPTCDCSNCCCYLCCGCAELYTPDEMLINNTKLTLCPLTSKVINPILGSTTGKKSSNHPAACLASPLTLIADIILIIPRCIAYCLI